MARYKKTGEEKRADDMRKLAIKEDREWRAAQAKKAKEGITGVGASQRTKAVAQSPIKTPDKAPKAGKKKPSSVPTFDPGRSYKKGDVYRAPSGTFHEVTTSGGVGTAKIVSVPREYAEARAAGRHVEARRIKAKHVAGGGVTGAGAAQRKAAVKASPLKPLPKGRVESYDPRKGPTTEQKRANAVRMGKDPSKVKGGAPSAGKRSSKSVVDTRTPQAQAESNRKLVMSERQIKRRAARAAQRRAKGLD